MRLKTKKDFQKFKMLCGGNYRLLLCQENNNLYYVDMTKRIYKYSLPLNLTNANIKDIAVEYLVIQRVMDCEYERIYKQYEVEDFWKRNFYDFHFNRKRRNMNNE